MRQHVSIKTDAEGNAVACMKNGDGSYVEFNEAELVDQIEVRMQFFHSTIQEELALKELRASLPVLHTQ